MATEGSITVQIGKLLARGPESQCAAQHLWERYCPRLLELAQRHLRGLPRRAADEEDVVVVAFERFCRAAQQRRFAQLQDRNDLWQLLLVLTEREAVNQVRATVRQKRGGGQLRGESALDQPDEAGDGRAIEQVEDPKPTPEFAAQLTENLEARLRRLGEPVLRDIALFKLEGFTNEEIADKLGCSLPTVERKCRRIRKIWQEEPEHE